MRITGGEAKGRRIKVPDGIRPTQDKLRAIIFDALGDRVRGSRFIDLFAGSGSVGIEALSRGAREAIFVEQSRRVVKVLKDNLESLDYLNRSKVIAQDALKSTKKFFDYKSIRPSDHPTIIFADPPYTKGFVKKIIQLFPNTTSRRSKVFNLESQCPSGLPLIIIEHSKYEPIELGKHYKSGDTIITFYLTN